MAYWHMQLPSKASLRGAVKKNLELNSLISFEDIEENKDLIEKFEKNIQINDLILIKNGNIPMALIKIIGEFETIKFTNSYQRKVEVLDWATTTMDTYPLGGNTQELWQHTSEDYPAYQYIEKWYKNGKQELIHGIKLRKLYISEHKMFKKFQINFTDNNDNPLPIIVIAGLNGTGKTTLLEYVFRNHFLNIGAFYGNSTNYIEIEDHNEIKLINKESEKKKREIRDYLDEEAKKNGIAGIYFDDSKLYYGDLNKEIIFIQATDNSATIDIKKNIIDFYRRESRELDSYSEAINKIQTFLKNVFDDLDIRFTIDDIDDTSKDHEKVKFKNNVGDIFEIEALSSGEKTLLSKVLNLYFKDIKNQIVLIDEPELSLHPAWQNKVLKLYEKFAIQNNCQIILTTHSPHIIGSAKNEYIKILKFDESGHSIEVVDNIFAYGRDIEWVLEEIMGANFLREKHILDKLMECGSLINKRDFNGAEKRIDEIEAVIGAHDKEILRLRNELFFERVGFEED